MFNIDIVVLQCIVNILSDMSNDSFTIRYHEGFSGSGLSGPPQLTGKMVSQTAE